MFNGMRRIAIGFALAVGFMAVTVVQPAEAQQQKDRTVEIVNNTPFPLRNLFVSRVGANEWTNKLPGAYILPAGARHRFNFSDGVAGRGSCMRDLWFDLPGYGWGVRMNNQNICDSDKIALFKWGNIYYASIR